MSEKKVMTGTIISGSKTVTYDLTNFNLSPGTFEVRVCRTSTAPKVITLGEPLILSVKALAAPVLRIEDTLLKWDAVPNAAGYRVYYTDTYLDTTATELDISTLGLAHGEYTFKVRAIGNTAPVSYSQMRLSNVSYVYSSLVAVNYNVNGDITTELVESGSIVKLPAVNIEGLTFGGWFYDIEFKNKVAAADTVAANITLYAKLTRPTVGNDTETDTQVKPAEQEPAKKDGSIFKTYWWAFSLGAAVVLGLLVLILAPKKKGGRR